tara:strand:- start:966 stop:1262 length:297 start_codon:yes stop_codon:yes gene_type:complete
MKKTILLLIMGAGLYPSHATAGDKIWFSNKTEVGYGSLFIAEQIKFEDGLFASNTVFAGAKIKVEPLKLQTFYSLEQSRKNDWQAKHSIGLRLDFKFN